MSGSCRAKVRQHQQDWALIHPRVYQSWQPLQPDHIQGGHGCYYHTSELVQVMVDTDTRKYVCGGGQC